MLLFCWSSINCLSVAESTGMYRYSTPSVPCNDRPRKDLDSCNATYVISIC